MTTSFYLLLFFVLFIGIIIAIYAALKLFSNHHLAPKPKTKKVPVKPTKPELTIETLIEIVKNKDASEEEVHKSYETFLEKFPLPVYGRMAAVEAKPHLTFLYYYWLNEHIDARTLAKTLITLQKENPNYRHELEIQNNAAIASRSVRKKKLKKGHL